MTISNSKGKRFPVEFKAEAVRLLLLSGKSQEQLGKELGVSGVSLGKWKRAAIDQADHPVPNYKGPKIDSRVLQEENLRLKKELETVRQEREILKKSLGILSQDPLQRGMP